jgi:putative peptide zinc metalloprotease protein
VPPGPPPSNSDDDKDRGFERKLWWLLILLLLFALLLTGMNIISGMPAWSEMPADHALLQGQRGTVTAVVGGKQVVLHKGDKVYVSEHDSVAVRDHSTGLLTFRGGGYTILCGGSDVTVGPLASAGYPVAPSGEVRLDAGTLLADTAATSDAFRPLALSVATGGATLDNAGAARFSAAGGAADVSAGLVSKDSVRLPVTGDDLSCGDGTALAPAAPSASPSPTDPLSPTALASPSLTPSPSPSPAQSPRRSPTPSPTRKASPSPARTTSPPPADKPPVIGGITTRSDLIYAVDANGAVCSNGSPSTTDVLIDVTDPDNTQKSLTVKLTYVVEGFPATKKTVSTTLNGSFIGTVGPLSDASTTTYQSPMDLTVTASDGKKTVTKDFPAVITFQNCRNG